MCIDPRAKHQLEISDSDMQARADADYSQSSCIWIHLILCPHIFCSVFTLVSRLLISQMWCFWIGPDSGGILQEIYFGGMGCSSHVTHEFASWDDIKKKYAQNTGISNHIARESIGLFLSVSVWAAFRLDGLEIFYFTSVPKGDLSVFKKNRTNS